MASKGSEVTPKTIERCATALFLVVIGIGIWAFFKIPPDERTRKEVIELVGAVVGAVGVVSLLLLWAQLRHTAVLARLLCYHQYFHDLPNINKVQDLYKVLARCAVRVPSWHEPLSDSDLGILLADKATPPDVPELVIREYLNDFEEFAAAVNSGLIEEDYAYRLEATRALTAYYGFQVVVDHWHAEDKRMSSNSNGQVPVTSNYYGELRSVAERWKIRKDQDNRDESKLRDRQGIRGKF